MAWSFLKFECILYIYIFWLDTAGHGRDAFGTLSRHNKALFFGGEDKLPVFIARQTIMGIVVDPCAAIMMFIVTGILCTGIKESSLAQGIVTTMNVCAMIFVIIAGGYLGFKTGWVGYELPSGVCPFGVSGMLAGSATVFFSYIGFDSITGAAEEVKNPQRDLPLGIGISLFMCCCLYMLVSAVIVGLVPYYELDPDTPISSAFANYGMEWAMYIITTGAVTALGASLIGGVLPQPRILMAMARDGLLPSFFSEINERTQVPVKSTIVTGIFAATLAFFMDVSQLAGMVSVGTLLAFTAVAISLLVLRYVPPNKVPLPPSLQESIYLVSLRYSGGNQDIDGQHSEHPVKSWDGNGQHSLDNGETLVKCPLIQKEVAQGELNEEWRHKIAAWNIALVCIGVLALASAASAEELPSIPRFTLCGVGGVLLLCGLIVLTCIDQDDARHNFGHTGGFVCPFVPLLPVACILINTYLLINLGAGTWIRVSVWLVAGALLYAFYGRKHSALLNAIYVPTSHVDEIYRSASRQI
ncbi:cationic amino acid transporter 2, vacuolar isoform X2 [Cornus florida]|uniref:cationic amino acid transporter 2, vacuolar isoform X2 n=1 Tax=Cornus florida TaxID=4283 RepID=UPI0028A07D47|nr:cationic amino acid transporter 2, vacuolar isoform X2 [Cornus florida]